MSDSPEVSSEAVSIFEYENARDYLRAVYRAKRKTHPSLTLGAWVRQMGVKHPALLSMVLGGRRQLTPSFAKKIKPTLRLKTHEEKSYFDYLVKFSHSTNEEEKQIFYDLMKKARLSPNCGRFEEDHLKIFSGWYYLPIIEMTQLKDFREDPQWIASRLGRQILASQAKEALECLMRVGLLVRDSNGKLKKSSETFNSSTDRPNPDLKRLHEQFLSKAIDSIYEQPVENRDISGHTIPIREKDLPEIKKRLQSFRLQIADEFSAKDADRVYQLGLQCFELTSPDYGA